MSTNSPSPPAAGATSTRRPSTLRRAPSPGLLLALPALLSALAAPSHAQLSARDLHFIWSDYLEGEPQAYSELGHTLASGDFDGDGRDDLAIGAPGATVGGQLYAGQVYVLYTRSGGDLGSPGFDPTQVPHEVIHQDVPGVGGAAEAGDFFGSSMTVGDFDGDGYDDLVVGAAFEAVGVLTRAGIVHVFHGSSGGLRVADEVSFLREDLGGLSETHAEFGRALAAGDFDDDGYDDLVVGMPGATIDGLNGAGAIVFAYGSPTGVLAATGDWLSQFQLGAHNPDHVVTGGASFGAALAVGDLDADGVDDLAIGVPRDALRTPEPASYPSVGSVAVVFGSDGTGLVRQGNLRLLSHHPQNGARYGHAVATGDVDGNGLDDLVISEPDADGLEHVDEGRVHVRYQRGAIPFATQTDFGEVEATGKSGAMDHVGRSLAVADLDGDGYDDVVAGAPRDNFVDGGGEVRPDSGRIVVAYGRSTPGLSRFVSYVQGEADLHGVPEDSDRFGHGLTVGNFSGAGPVLVIGAPGEQYSTYPHTGSVLFMRSSTIFRDGFEGGDPGSWR